MKKIIAMVFAGSLLFAGCGGSIVDKANALAEKSCACKDDKCKMELLPDAMELMKEIAEASPEEQKAAGEAMAKGKKCSRAASKK
jgi:hypothetical protein